MAKLPLCLCGVRGGDLTQRIHSILDGRRRAELTVARRTVLSLGAVAVIAAPVVAGALTMPPETVQSTVSGNRRFDVVSVRRNASGDTNMRVRLPRARFEATNIQIRELIRIAYGFQSFQLADGPEWLTTERYDILATADRAYAPGPEGAAPEVIAMVRTMLSERFGIQLRPEKRELPLFELHLARSDRRLGSGMRPVEVDCLAETRRLAAPAPSGQPWPASACNVQVASTQLKGRGLTLAQLATAISRVAGIDRAVVDRTGLTGTFDVDLSWTPETRTAAGDASSMPPDAPGFFTAVQEQLGLRLESRRGPVEVFVIAGATRPAEN